MFSHIYCFFSAYSHFSILLSLCFNLQSCGLPSFFYFHLSYPSFTLSAVLTIFSFLLVLLLLPFFPVLSIWSDIDLLLNSCFHGFFVTVSLFRLDFSPCLFSFVNPFCYLLFPLIVSFTGFPSPVLMFFSPQFLELLSRFLASSIFTGYIRPWKFLCMFYFINDKLRYRVVYTLFSYSLYCGPLNFLLFTSFVYFYICIYSSFVHFYIFFLLYFHLFLT